MKSQISNPHVCHAKIHHFGPTQKALPVQWLQVRRAERYGAQSKHPHPIFLTTESVPWRWLWMVGDLTKIHMWFLQNLRMLSKPRQSIPNITYITLWLFNIAMV